MARRARPGTELIMLMAWSSPTGWSSPKGRWLDWKVFRTEAPKGREGRSQVTFGTGSKELSKNVSFPRKGSEFCLVAQRT